MIGRTPLAKHGSGAQRGPRAVRGLPGLALLSLALVATGQEPVQETPVSGEPAPSEASPAATEEVAAAAETPTGRTPLGPRYRSLEEREDITSRWLGSGLAETLSLGLSAGGRELFCVQFGAPGPKPLRDRTTIFLVGGLDGVSLAGSEAVLRVVDELLATPERMPVDVAFVALPWANPDGLARIATTGCVEGRNDRAIDEDGDGQEDEDLPDDLDGDGFVLEMLLEDPEGPWVRVEDDDRLLRPALAGEAPRYVRVPEGRDDDGDGRFNEDQSGGVRLDRNFPVHWAGPWSGELSGPFPLSEPATRALAEEMLARRTAVVLSFQGNHGRLAGPGGVSGGPGVLELPFPADVPIHRTALELYRLATGRDQSGLLTLAQASGTERPGALLDWAYAALGALSLEIGVWGPGVEGAVTALAEGQFTGETSQPTDGAATRAERPPTQEEVDRAWVWWLDEMRDGLGFLPWQPVDVGGGRSALVGGWEPFTRYNPPAELLEGALRGLDDFVSRVATALPGFEIEVEEKSRDGVVAVLAVTVRNTGRLRSGVGPTGTAQGNPSGPRLELFLPSGVRLLSGERVVELGHLPGLGRSQRMDWLLIAPENTALELSIESPWTARVTKEVRL